MSEIVIPYKVTPDTEEPSKKFVPYYMSEYSTFIRLPYGYTHACQECDISELVGKTLTRIEGAEKDSEYVLFECDDGTSYAMYHDQDCCEYVRIEDVSGDISRLIGKPITMATALSNDNHESDVGDYLEDSWTYTFYHFATVRGYLTIRWFGESNGYYSEDAIFTRVIKTAEV